jgi:hypothetical protein
MVTKTSDDHDVLICGVLRREAEAVITGRGIGTVPAAP